MKKSYVLMVLWALLTSLNAISLPKLSSFPSARATIYLDFDGETVVSSTWNGGNPIVCAPCGMTDAQVTETFNRVSEDYRPFNINITTDLAVFLAAPLNMRIRIIITPTSSWYPAGVGGISYTGSFTWGDDTPGFVFCDRLPNTPKFIGECCTHESGHTVGLSHQSSYSTNCTLTATYNVGSGSGEIGWAPVMGNSYYKNLTGWNNGPTPNGCSESQDNLSIITTQNGFTFRPDDHSDDPNNNPTLVPVTNQLFSTNGIISTTTDKDAFKFVFAQKGALHLDATPYSVAANLDGADLDIRVTLLNAAKQTIGTYDPSTLLNAVIDTILNAGTYYVLVQGTGNVNTSNYGSLGSYTVSGTFSQNGLLPIKDAALTGKTDKNSHTLNWNIIADEKIKSIVIETSKDGITFNTLISVLPDLKSFTYSPIVSGDIFYRLHVTSVMDQSIYSNVITLKSQGSAEKMFKVSSLIHNEIVVNAGANYQYIISDITGKIIAKGNNSAGINKINMNNNPNGIYVMQIVNNTQIITERILKQ